MNLMKSEIIEFSSWQYPARIFSSIVAQGCFARVIRARKGQLEILESLSKDRRYYVQTKDWWYSIWNKASSSEKLVLFGRPGKWRISLFDRSKCQTIFFGFVYRASKPFPFEFAQVAMREPPRDFPPPASGTAASALQRGGCRLSDKDARRSPSARRTAG